MRGVPGAFGISSIGRRFRCGMEGKSQPQSALTFHCADEHGGWLGFRGPVVVDDARVIDCVTALLTGVPGCHQVTVWLEGERVLVACRTDKASDLGSED